MNNLVLLLALQLAMFVGAASASKPTDCTRPLVESRDDSSKQGVLLHGEHWVDLILRQGGRRDLQPFETFSAILEDLVRDIGRGQIARVNEKIDGSPSVVLGFDDADQPFVAYKSHFTRRAQGLVRKVADARAATNDPGSGLTLTLASLIRTARAPLRKVAPHLRDYVFQADVLFTEGDDRRVIEEQRITIRSNVLEYAIDESHPLYAPVRAARAGVVVHSVGRRKIDGQGRVSVEAVSSSEAEERLVRDFMKSLEGSRLFAVHPWQDDVALDRVEPDRVERLHDVVASRVTRIRDFAERASGEFRAEWPKYEPKFRTFLNSCLRPPHDGGFYRAAAEGRDLAATTWFADFALWLRGRNDVRLAERFEAFAADRSEDLRLLLDAYGSAVHLQASLMPSLRNAMRSKLGGGEVEGLMLKTDQAVVKLVDRLGFTLRNNANRGPGAAVLRTLEKMPAPFDAWRPGVGVLVLKGQPIHAGHVAMVERALEMNGDRPLVVFASDKQPNLRAKTWKDTKTTDLKSSAERREYVHLFGRKFRGELAAHAFGKKNVTFVMGPHSTIWSYLEYARSNGLAGKINYYVGAKESAAGRYDEQIHEFRDNLEVREIPAQVEGLSATEVRRALAIAATGDRRERAAARKVLDRALAYVPDVLERRRLMARMIARWKRVDRVVQETLPAKPAKASGSSRR